MLVVGGFRPCLVVELLVKPTNKQTNTSTPVFAKHDARLSVTADDHAFVMVDAFDRSEVTVLASDVAKICVNRYGGARVVVAPGSTGQIKIIEKHKETY